MPAVLPRGCVATKIRIAVKTDFRFQSEGEAAVGDLFLPERSKPIGVVVAVGPLTSVKEQAAGTYARAMSERGYAALAFDYRYFGESGGEPRQFESPDANIEDIGNAASALLADERLTDLPVFGLGICFGAGPMVRAVVAEDSRFRAFAVVAGVYTDKAGTMAGMGDAYQAAIDRGRAAERRWREPARPRPSRRWRPTAATSRCHSARRMSSTARRAAGCPTTSTAMPCSHPRTPCRSMRATRRTRSACRS
jgi:alpha-beta hydrolase superfamily lysophospholipase